MTHEHISKRTEISVVQSVLEWLVSHNLFCRNITLDKRLGNWNSRKTETEHGNGNLQKSLLFIRFFTSKVTEL